MNEHLKYVEVELGQSSKGAWYCKSLKVSVANAQDLNFELTQLIPIVESQCDEHNQKADPPKKEDP